MKLSELIPLFEDKTFKDDENGSLVYGWKNRKDLCDEEGNKNYIPVGYTKILELGGIYANEPGKGQGDRLMKHFLASAEAEKAELIFLDPVPGLGKNWGSSKTEADQIAALIRFYKRYGFQHNPRSATKRMWLVKKGNIDVDKLPT